MQVWGEKPAIFWKDLKITYSQFLGHIATWESRLADDGVTAGSICAFKGDFSPSTCALMFALIKKNAILVPFTNEISAEIPGFMEIAGVETLYRFDSADLAAMEKINAPPFPPLIQKFSGRGHAGLIVFTSGSTGAPKAILHDCESVMRKFVVQRHAWDTILFLLMDHFGGFNTFLSSFANGGMAVCPQVRTAEGVARAIQESRATLLPTTPTFLNLIIMSRLYLAYDFSSVKMITYGTELMSDTLLKRVVEVFPNAQIKQTYGLSELGVLRSNSESKDSVWLKVGGSGFEVKVVGGKLWVRSESNMVGYLNAPSPFDEEGWMCTGDEVEQRGEFIRFLGRKSEVINVGGQKVYPIEVEDVLLKADNVSSAVVFSKTHPVMGQVVHAQVSLLEPESATQLTERLRRFCNERLPKYKVPMRFEIASEQSQHSRRFKKIRRDTLQDGSPETRESQ